MPWEIPFHVPLPTSFKGYDPDSSPSAADFTHYQRHLPHWRLLGACYFVTFRLGDSIPAPILAELQSEANQWSQQLKEWRSQNNGKLATEQNKTWQAFQRSRLRMLENILDEAHGECLLRNPKHRQIVADALRYFEGSRCEMLAYTVMPNHVHALCRPLGQHTIQDLCASWKWFTAKKIQSALLKQGSLWQAENFDRIIRDADHYTATVRYIAKNPIKANLNEDDASVWFCKSICQVNDWTTNS